MIDNGSRKGTWVNGEPVETGSLLDGDVIEFVGPGNPAKPPKVKIRIPKGVVPEPPPPPPPSPEELAARPAPLRTPGPEAASPRGARPGAPAAGPAPGGTRRGRARARRTWRVGGRRLLLHRARGRVDPPCAGGARPDVDRDREAVRLGRLGQRGAVRRPIGARDVGIRGHAAGDGAPALPRRSHVAGRGDERRSIGRRAVRRLAADPGGLPRPPGRPPRGRGDPGGLGLHGRGLGHRRQRRGARGVGRERRPALRDAGRRRRAGQPPRRRRLGRGAEDEAPCPLPGSRPARGLVRARPRCRRGPRAGARGRLRGHPRRERRHVRRRSRAGGRRQSHGDGGGRASSRAAAAGDAGPGGRPVRGQDLRRGRGLRGPAARRGHVGAAIHWPGPWPEPPRARPWWGPRWRPCCFSRGRTSRVRWGSVPCASPRRSTPSWTGHVSASRWCSRRARSRRPAWPCRAPPT